jgi:hypothetical protein
MSTARLTLALAIASVFTFSACDGPSGEAITSPPGIANQIAPQTDSAAVIVSAGSLSNYLKTTAQSGSPLDELPPQARARFLAGLTFNSRGIAGFNYADLQADLTASQVYRILALFGAQRDTQLIGARVVSSADRAAVQPVQGSGGEGTDHKDYECVSAGTCSPQATYICMSNC